MIIGLILKADWRNKNMAWLTVNFNSKSLNMPVMLDILIPQGRGGYKQLYLLHGAGGDHTSWITKSRAADYAEGKNIAVIMPSGNNKCYVNNRYGKDYFTFLTEELVEKCETWFSLSDKKEDRYIGGMSMGGYGAVHAALKRPDLYSAAFSYSGLLDISERFARPQGLDLSPVFGKEEEFSTQDYDLFDFIRKMRLKNNENVDKTTEFILTCGLQDKRINMTTRFFRSMQVAGYKVSYIEGQGNHDWDYWDRCIHNTLEYISGKNKFIEDEEASDWRKLCQ